MIIKINISELIKVHIHVIYVKKVFQKMIIKIDISELIKVHIHVIYVEKDFQKMIIKIDISEIINTYTCNICEKIFLKNDN